MKKRNLFLIFFIAIIAMACSSNGKTEQKEANQSAITTNLDDSSITKVYYFHGKQRCKTCIAVGSLAQKTIEEAYAQNDKVQFIEIDTSNKEFADLVEKYEVSWNALIVAKGNKSVDLTEQAFATAVNSPELLEAKLKEEVFKLAE